MFLICLNVLFYFTKTQLKSLLINAQTKTDKRTTQSLKVVNVKMETIYTQGTTHRSTSLCFSQGHGPQKSLNFELKEEG